MNSGAALQGEKKGVSVTKLLRLILGAARLEIARHNYTKERKKEKKKSSFLFAVVREIEIFRSCFPFKSRDSAICSRGDEYGVFARD